MLTDEQMDLIFDVMVEEEERIEDVIRETGNRAHYDEYLQKVKKIISIMQ